MGPRSRRALAATNEEGIGANWQFIGLKLRREGAAETSKADRVSFLRFA